MLFSPVLRLHLEHISTLFCVLKGPVGLYHIDIDKCEHGDLEIKGSSWLLTVGGKHRSHCDQSCSMELL